MARAVERSAVLRRVIRHERRFDDFQMGRVPKWNGATVYSTTGRAGVEERWRASARSVDNMETPLQTEPREDGRRELKQIRRALKTVLDRLDESGLSHIVDANCAMFADYEPGVEAMHEWWNIHQMYMSECDALISGVLAELDTTADEVFALGRRCRGRDERIADMVERLQTAADFEEFCGMMRERHEILQMLYGPSGMNPFQPTENGGRT